ncbi:hypothetical protein GBF38_017681 [Nibea albiflora]|uniref:Uncharacterized protein n=1 Tax=Nibea albiflora TaxID=240163 RepID=A0ACB7F4G4_NIBAL|nr:hypothetical protein GBF38_017681 [Nibea albiflora]
MGFTIWLCVLCLQASLLSHALDCSGATQGELCVSGQTADGQALFRRKRQLEHRGSTHLSHSSLPGAVSVKGFPNTLIQVVRARRQVKIEPPNRRNSGRSGAFSVLGDPQNDGQEERPKRSIQKISSEK